jgi:hypothetical protein
MKSKELGFLYQWDEKEEGKFKNTILSKLQSINFN